MGLDSSKYLYRSLSQLGIQRQTQIFGNTYITTTTLKFLSAFPIESHEKSPWEFLADREGLKEKEVGLGRDRFRELWTQGDNY